jgi:hypothetical protein
VDIESSRSKGTTEPARSPAAIAAAAEIQAELEREGIHDAGSFDPELVRVALPYFRQRIADRTLPPVENRTRFLAQMLWKPAKYGFRKTAERWIPPAAEGLAKAIERNRAKEEARTAAKKLASDTGGQVNLARMHVAPDQEKERKRLRENRWQELTDLGREEIRRSVRVKMGCLFRGKTDRDFAFYQACLGEMERRPLPVAAPSV